MDDLVDKSRLPSALSATSTTPKSDMNVKVISHDLKNVELMSGKTVGIILDLYSSAEDQQSYFDILRKVKVKGICFYINDYDYMDISSKEGISATIDAAVKLLKYLTEYFLQLEVPFQIIFSSQMVLNIFMNSDTKIARFFKSNDTHISEKIDDWAKRLKQYIPQNTSTMLYSTAISAAQNQAKQYGTQNKNGVNNAISDWISGIKASSVNPIKEWECHTNANFKIALFLLIEKNGISCTLHVGIEPEDFLVCIFKDSMPDMILTDENEVRARNDFLPTYERTPSDEERLIKTLATSMVTLSKQNVSTGVLEKFIIEFIHAFREDETESRLAEKMSKRGMFKAVKANSESPLMDDEKKGGYAFAAMKANAEVGGDPEALRPLLKKLYKTK